MGGQDLSFINIAKIVAIFKNFFEKILVQMVNFCLVV